MEVAYETLLVRVVTSLFKTKRYASWLGKSGVETEFAEFDAERMQEVLQIKDAISRSRHLFWARKCLIESVAGKRILDRRKIPATLYLGVNKAKGKMTAHAWLRSGNVWVSGGRNRLQFTVVGMFS
jgi:hypothetical protein